jgi:hypothetical protein
VVIAKPRLSLILSHILAFEESHFISLLVLWACRYWWFRWCSKLILEHLSVLNDSCCLFKNRQFGFYPELFSSVMYQQCCECLVRSFNSFNSPIHPSKLTPYDSKHELIMSIMC